jgi:hypothetical protein
MGYPFAPTGTWGVKTEATRGFPREGFFINDEIHEMGGPFTDGDRRVLDRIAVEIRGIPGHVQAHRNASFGRIAEPFENPAIVRFYLGGIQYTLGALDGMNQ